jgi:hypothetical protein
MRTCALYHKTGFLDAVSPGTRWFVRRLHVVLSALERTDHGGQMAVLTRATGEMPRSAAVVTAPSRAVSAESGLPIFQQNWWLEIAYGQQPVRVLTVEKYGRIVGRLQYRLTKRNIFFLWGDHAYWTHLAGPVLCQDLSMGEKVKILDRLMAQLPRHISFCFIISPAGEDARLIKQAFIRAGFDCRPTDTYRDQIHTEPALEGMNSKHRGHIRRAVRDLEVVEISPREYVTFYAQNLAVAGRRCHSPLDIAEALIAQGLQRGQAKVFAARKRGADTARMATMDAAIACLIDQERMYLWTLTYRPAQQDEGRDDRPHPDAIKLLIVRAIEAARSRHLIFDADGLYNEGSRHLYEKIFHLRRETRDVVERRTDLYKMITGTIDRCPRFVKQAIAWTKRLLRLDSEYLR